MGCNGPRDAGTHRSPNRRAVALALGDLALGDNAGEVHPELAELLAKQPYTVALDGLTLAVDEDVFPPDLGRCARNMATVCAGYAARRALEMGCGSGYLALALKQSGALDVWAADVHGPAVECARRNVARNPHVGPVTVVRSDLFDAIPASLTFDLVAFNQPFAPSKGGVLCGCGPDGGYRLTRRFLIEAEPRLAPGGVAVMAFSDRARPEHNPARIAKELGYEVTTLLHAYYAESHNFIYEIRPAS